MLAADQGYVLAEYAVAYSYYTGLGAEQNYGEAVRYFNLAADQDLVEAWVALGECYYKGNGVEKDFEKSAEMYQKALDHGFEPGEEDQAIIDEVLG
ncbi:tetratricopeptide repeat protein [Butyrivibrio sp. VCD2006]|uniref:tetratricopeptide repeat protein n=1 Tax=Butyrivibrio sp. VCD2006 TaxID=1280664 RepID=UPI00068553BF|nr:sel1 repeat family protein [Butyrivibrio sp. VCD2006]